MLHYPTFKEIEHLGNIFYITKERLACQTYCNQGTLTVEVLKEKVENIPFWVTKFFFPLTSTSTTTFNSKIHQYQYEYWILGVLREMR